MKILNALRRTGLLAGVLTVLLPGMVLLFTPHQASAAGGVEKPVNVWKPGAVSPGYPAPTFPMTSQTVTCYPILNGNNKSTLAATDVVTGNNIPYSTGGGVGIYPATFFQSIYQAPTSADDIGLGPSGVAKDALKAAQDSNNKFNVITFWSATPSQAKTCEQAGMLLQYPAGSANFYGGFVANYSINGYYRNVLLTATVTPTGTLSFHDPLCNFRLTTDKIPCGINYSDQVTNWNNNVINGTGGGGNDLCPVNANFAAITNTTVEANCVKAYSGSAFFKSQNAIVFAGATFVATKWGGSDSAVYNLQDEGGNTGWLAYKPSLQFIWVQKGPPGGVGGSLRLDSPEKFATAMNALGSGGWIDVVLHSSSKYHQGFEDHFHLSTQYLSYVANYNPGDNTVSTLFTPDQGGGNEAQILGIYKYNPISVGTTPGVSYSLAAGGSGCQGDGTRPYFVSDRVLSDKSLVAGQTVAATWYINMNNNCSAFTPVNVQIQIGKNGQTAPSPNPTGDQSKNTTPGCEDSGVALAWIMCPVIEGLINGVNAVYDNFIVPMLVVTPLSSNTSNSVPVKNAWTKFRVFGNIFLVIVLLIVVFGESIGGGLVDAYTAKKILPKILAGAILINLSFYIVAGFIDITNVLGDGLRNLITGAFGINNAGQFNLTGTSGGTQAGVGSVALLGLTIGWAAIDGAAIVGGIIWVLFVLLPMIFFLFLGIMAVLAIRLGLIYALALFSPLAFALWILPNTEKYFKKWWELLQTTALVYPIISALFGLSIVMAQATTWATGNRGAINGAIGFIITLIIIVMPLVLIPFAFKLAGGVLGRAYELANGMNSRGNQWLKNRAERRKDRMLNDRFLNPQGLGGTKWGGRINKALQRNAIRSLNENDEARGTRFGFTPKSRAGRAERLSTLQTDRAIKQQGDIAKAINEIYGGDENKTKAAMEAYKNGKFDASLLRKNLSGMYKKNAETGEYELDATGNRIRAYDDAQIEQTVARVEQMRGRFGDRAFKIGSAQSYLSNGTVGKTANVEAMKWIADATKGDTQAGINAMLGAAEQAKQAGRGDLFSSSPTHNIEAFQQVVAMGDQAHDSEAGQAITQKLLAQAVTTRSPGELAMLKGDGLERVTPLMAGELSQAEQIVGGLEQSRVHAATQAAVETATKQATSVRQNLDTINLQLRDAQATGNQAEVNRLVRERRTVEANLTRAQTAANDAVTAHQQATAALEATPEYQELMHQSARVQGMADILGQIPDGKAREYGENLLGVKLFNGQTIGKFVSSSDVTSNEVYRRYHREYSDAEAVRNASAQAAANAAAGNTGNPVGPPTFGPPTP